MKSTKFMFTFAVFGLAASVTAGSVYVTARAGAQQEVEEVVNEVEAASAVVEVSGAISTPLAPEQVISNRSQDIFLDAAGGFSGRLSRLAGKDNTLPSSGVTVKVVQDGVAVGEATTNDDGVFSFTGLKPGVAALLSYSEDSFLLFGLRLVEPDDKNAASVETDIDSVVVRGADLETVRSIIAAQLTNGDVRFNVEQTLSDEAFPYGTGDVSTSLVGHRVMLQADGSLKGAISLMDERTGRLREVLDLTVYFVRDGKVVGKALVGNDGGFSVTGLNPGIHSVVGVGNDGTFAMGVEILGSEYEDAAVDGSSRGSYRPVAVTALLQMSIAPAGAGNFNQGNAGGLTGGSLDSGVPGVAGTAPPAPAPAGAPPGAGGGGAFGGGGGGPVGGGGAGAGGGIGGLGALLGAGLGAGIGYAVGQDDAPASAGI